MVTVIPLACSEWYVFDLMYSICRDLRHGLEFRAQFKSPGAPQEIDVYRIPDPLMQNTVCKSEMHGVGIQPLRMCNSLPLVKCFTAVNLSNSFFLMSTKIPLTVALVIVDPAKMCLLGRMSGPLLIYI